MKMKVSMPDTRNHQPSPGRAPQTGERQARRVTAALLKQEVLAAEASRAPLHLNFPARLATEWTPGLFPPETS